VSRSSLVRAIAMASVALLAFTACSDDAATSETVANSGAPDVEFLDGELPEALPSDFPIPAEAGIGTGMINRTTGQIELILRIPAAVPAVVEFFEANFEARDYTVTSSQAEGASGWTVAFEKDGATGSVDMSPVGDQLTQLVIRVQQ
jgi:hypothetical protein